MATPGASGGDKLLAALNERLSKQDAAVRVGFLEGAKYPDGLQVAQVAFWNEYGRVGQVPRPFFRGMIAAKSAQWPDDLAKILKATGGDQDRALGLMGERIKDQLQGAINDFQSPALRPATVAAKGFAKPLIETAVMLRSVGYEVVKP